MHRLAFLVNLLPLVAGHGFVSSPSPRRPGDAYRAVCGEQPFYQQSADINGNVQGIQQVVGQDKTDACNLWLCKGFVLDDNKDKVQSYSLGQTIDFKVTIAAPHSGFANVSVVKTSTNTMIGDPLIEFDNYASNSGFSANNTAFSVTLPSSLGGDCKTAGDCVLQWYWDAPDIDQTYEACIDFTVSDSGSGSTPSAAPSSSAAVATSKAAATSTSVVSIITSTSVTPTSVGSVEPTSTAIPESDNDECPADDDEDEGDDEDDEDCPADGGEDDEDEGEDSSESDEECPADDGEDGETSQPVPSATASAGPSAAEVSQAPAYTSTITQVVTSTVVSEKLVTVTAAATACA